MRSWLYSVEKPEGQIFVGDDIAAKLAEGWVESPALVSVEPPKPKVGRPRKEQA